ncbi:MAG: PepSY domain-containing protein [Hyphomicrobium sp.]
MLNKSTLAASVAALGALVVVGATPAAADHHRGKRHHAHEAHHGHHKHHHARKHCKHKHVAHALHAKGFVSWDEIEWDDGVWEIDDARRADGSQYDLKLHPKTLHVIHRQRER